MTLVRPIPQPSRLLSIPPTCLSAFFTPPRQTIGDAGQSAIAKKSLTPLGSNSISYPGNSRQGVLQPAVTLRCSRDVFTRDVSDGASGDRSQRESALRRAEPVEQFGA